MAGDDLDGLGQVPRVAFSVVDCVCIRARTGPAKKCPVRSTGLRNAAGSWALLVIAVALQFWLFPWGSYEITFEDKVPITRVAGPIQALASLILAGGWPCCLEVSSGLAWLLVDCPRDGCRRRHNLFPDPYVRPPNVLPLLLIMLLHL